MNETHGRESRDCREIFERLSEYIDGELGSELCARLDEHLGNCMPCQDFLESLRRTVRWVESVEPLTVPDEVRRAVRAALREFGEDPAS